MTNQQKIANERYFCGISTMTRMYLWQDKGHLYNIEDGKFIAPNQRAYDDIKSITPSSFHNKVRKR